VTPTGRTVDRLRREGFAAGVVERWLPHTSITIDFLGFADVVAVHPDGRTLAVQATSAANVSARVKKLQACPAVPVCLSASWTVEVWGWDKRDGRWHVRRVQIRREGLAAVEAVSLPRRKPRRARKGERQAELFAATEGQRPE
jgi:hypothetical protein